MVSAQGAPSINPGNTVCLRFVLKLSHVRREPRKVWCRGHCYVGEYDSHSACHCRTHCSTIHVRSGKVSVIVAYQYSVREVIGKRLGKVSCDNCR